VYAVGASKAEEKYMTIAFRPRFDSKLDALVDKNKLPPLRPKLHHFKLNWPTLIPLSFQADYNHPASQQARKINRIKRTAPV
jgi:hypothetical protein